MASGMRPDVSRAPLVRSRMAPVACGRRTPYRQMCEVVGPDGAVLLTRPFQPEEEPAELIIRRSRGQPDERVEVAGTNQYVRMIDHFGDVVAGEPARHPPAEAIANMRVLDALRRAAQTGAPADVG